MRILHVITRLILGGAQENTVLTCEGLARRGCEVVLATGPALGTEGELLGRARRGGYETVLLPQLRREIHPLRDAAAYAAIRRLIRRFRPEVCHTHSSKAGILARQAAADAGVPCVVHTVHGLPFHPYQPAWKNRLYVALERRAAGQCSAILSVADAMTRQALGAGVGRPEQYRTVYSGMEADRFLTRPAGAEAFRRGLRLPEEAVLFTQVSRLAELKGHRFVLEAARRVRDRRAHFCFVGDGPWGGKIRRAVRAHEHGDRFRLTGLLPPRQIPAVMHASDALLHCSLREGLARALPQAMLAARPAVSFDVDGAAEVVDETTGVLLEAADVAGLAAAIDRLAGDAALRTRLGEAGRRRCRERFSAERMVEEIFRVYRGLLEGRGLPPDGPAGENVRP